VRYFGAERLRRAGDVTGAIFGVLWGSDHSPRPSHVNATEQGTEPDWENLLPVSVHQPQLINEYVRLYCSPTRHVWLLGYHDICTKKSVSE